MGEKRVTLPLADVADVFERAYRAGHLPTLAEWGNPDDQLRRAREEIDREGPFAGMPEIFAERAARRRAEENSAKLRAFEAWAAELRELQSWRGRPNTFAPLGALLVDSYRRDIQSGLAPDESGAQKKRSTHAAELATARVLVVEPLASLERWVRSERRGVAERTARRRVRRAGDQVRALLEKLTRIGMSEKDRRTLERAIFAAAGDFWAAFRMLRGANAEGKCIPRRAFDHPDEYPGIGEFCGIFTSSLQKLAAYAQWLDDIDVMTRTLDNAASPSAS